MLTLIITYQRKMGNECSIETEKLLDAQHCVKKRQELFDKYLGIKMDMKTKMMHKVIELQ